MISVITLCELWWCTFGRMSTGHVHETDRLASSLPAHLIRDHAMTPSLVEACGVVTLNDIHTLIHGPQEDSMEGERN